MKEQYQLIPVEPIKNVHLIDAKIIKNEDGTTTLVATVSVDE